MPKNKTIRSRGKNNKRKQSRRLKKAGGPEDMQQKVQNIQEQIAFVNEHAAEYDKIKGIRSSDLIQLLQRTLEYIQSHNGELPPKLQPYGIGSVALLQEQLSKVKDVIQNGGFSF